MGKGDDFERECCRYLSLWWSEGEDDDLIWRNRIRRTSKTPKREQQLGDLISTHPTTIPLLETFNIEIKTGYSKTRKGTKVKNIPWDILDIIDSTKVKGAKVFLDFWDQTLADAEKSNRIPVLIFKRDYHVPCVAMLRKDVRGITDFSGPSLLTCTKVTLSNNIDIFRRDTFFERLSPTAVRALHKETKGEAI